MKKILIPKEQIGEVFYAKQSIKFPKTSEFSKFSIFVPFENVTKKEDGSAEVLFDEEKIITAKVKNRRIKVTFEQLEKIFNGENVKPKEEYLVNIDKVLEKRLNYLSETLPSEMRTLPNWVVFKTKWNAEKDKKEKTLISPLTHRWAKPNDSSTWTDFETAKKFAIENNFEGLAFALNSDGITCIDLDHAIDKDGNLSQLAKTCLNMSIDTYCETSISGNGVHIFVKDDVLENGKYKNRALTAGGELEVYDNARIISISGNVRTENNELASCSDEFKKYLQATLGERKVERDVSSTVSRVVSSDAEVIELIQRSKKAKEFNDLMKGVSLVGDHSRDDFKLLNILAFFTDCNKEQMESIFRSSALYRPEKGDKYLAISIDKAIQTLSGRMRYNVNNTKKKNNSRKNNVYNDDRR